MKARTLLIGAASGGALLGGIFQSTGRPTWVVVTVYVLAAITALGAAAARPDARL